MSYIAKGLWVSRGSKATRSSNADGPVVHKNRLELGQTLLLGVAGSAVFVTIQNLTIHATYGTNTRLLLRFSESGTHVTQRNSALEICTGPCI
ncbi:hypothetical protein IFM47457_03344 [Aspergillus lentulus]|nr:hypothetical protein IFM47457_03344 [Aspergillus lentulus]